jgi:Uncharacterized protein conserved in bacteria (DUF2334)
MPTASSHPETLDQHPRKQVRLRGRPQVVDAIRYMLAKGRTLVLHGYTHQLADLLANAQAYEAMANAVNPYGDGHAAQRTADAVEHMFELGPGPHRSGPEVCRRSVTSSRALNRPDGPTAT